MIDEAQLNGVYTQRNALAIAFAKAALSAGWRAGRGYDDCPEVGWDPEWRHVVYVDLPNGQQVSWHMGPDVVHMLDQLPQYPGKWDGTSHGKDPAWCLFTAGPEGMPPHVQRMALEAAQLATRIEALAKFIGTEKFYQLAAEDQRLLHAQATAMAAYGDALAARLDRAEEATPA